MNSYAVLYFVVTMADKLTIQDKQYLAKILFTREQLDQKAIAKRVGVSENTVSSWVNKFNWKDLRRRLLLSKEDQLNNLYIQLENINEIIKESETGHADSKQADIISKLTSSIRSLETDLNINDLVESGIRFIKYAQKTLTVEQVHQLTDTWHLFIQANIKK